MTMITGSVSFGFIVVLKCGVEVEATAPVCLLVPQRPAGVKVRYLILSLYKACSLQVVHFPEHLRFSNLPVDFTIRLEVYVMVRSLALILVDTNVLFVEVA